MIRRHNNKNKNETNDSSLEIMNYLIQKLEARQKKVFKFKNLFQELDSFETFYSQRKEIFLLLNDLEDDLKQAIFAIKALTMQNKALLKDINIKINENKNISNQLNFTLGENENLKLKLNAINENKIENMQYPSKNINNNNNLLNINIESIKVDEEEEYEEPKMKNLDLNNKNINNNNINKKNNNINNNVNNNLNNIGYENFNVNNINNLNYQNQNEYEQLSNVKNIIKDMRKNKKDLKRIIEQHFKEQKMG